MIALVFPGQGSQKRGMGDALFDSVPEYATLEPKADALLGFSLRRLCREDPDHRLQDTQYTQPALFMVNALSWLKAARDGVRPEYLAGHSLGEYNALFAAGAFDLLTGLRLVKKRGELMSQAKDGGMAAVVGLKLPTLLRVLADHGLQSLDVANFNSPSQTVISGPLADIRRAAPLFETAGALLYAPLQVSAAFHSRYMAGAADEFARFLAPFTFEALRIPVIANVTALPVPTADASNAIKNLMVRQITHPVLWTRSIRYLHARGVAEFRETGPGNVLTRLIQQVQRESDG